MMHVREKYFSMLRAALKGEPTTDTLTDEEWRTVYEEVQRQSLVGVIFGVANNMSMPLELALEWASDAEYIRGMNGVLNEEAAQLTQLFAAHGRRTAILKGQANAMLYPDPMSRQPGDIDIWVEGGKKSVIALLEELDMMPEKDPLGLAYHHVHLPSNERGVTVEIHFRPSSGNFNPFSNRRLQRWLEQEIKAHTTLVQAPTPAGQPAEEQRFYVPSKRFALVMQLAHIQRHFFNEGVGLRQVCDYFLLLQSSTEQDRQDVAQLLDTFGLKHCAGALMWMLGKVLHMDEAHMLCKPDSKRGEWMLDEILAGGNFGQHAERLKKGLWTRVFLSRSRRLKLMRYDFWEVFWLEMTYWKLLVTRIPIRIKYRQLSLRGFSAKSHFVVAVLGLQKGLDVLLNALV